MNLADRAPSGMTADEFLARCDERPDEPHRELVAGTPVAMPPERNRRNLVKVDCLLALRQAVRSAGLDCTVVTTLLRDGQARLDPPGITFDVADCFEALRARNTGRTLPAEEA